MPWVMIIPSIDLSFSRGRIVSAIFFQSWYDMSSDAFINGVSIFVMLQILFISGAIFRISFSSVHVVPPVFGSSLADIVPPVMTKATFGSFVVLGVWVCRGMGVFVLTFSIVLASRISFSLIPIL